MSVKANYFKIGVFVIVAVGLLTAAIVSFAMPKLDKPIYVETYMDESVAGLNVGSQILYRGVKIGRVENISFALSRYNTNARYGRYVVLDMVIESEKLLGRENFQDVSGRLAKLVEGGLRIRITSNPLTGLSYLEADYPIGASDKLEYDWQPRYYYIPSDLSVLNKFAQSAQSAFEVMEKIDFAGFVEDFNKLINELRTAVQDARVKQFAEKAEGLVTELTETSRRLNALLGTEGDQPKAKVEDVLVKMEQSLVQIEDVLKNIDNLTNSQKPKIKKLIDDLKESAENIKEITGELKENPGRVLSKPAKTEVMK